LIMLLEENFYLIFLDLETYFPIFFDFFFNIESRF
jgi:hypothetical protein